MSFQSACCLGRGVFLQIELRTAQLRCSWTPLEKSAKMASQPMPVGGWMRSTTEHTSVLARSMLCGYCNSMGILILVSVHFRMQDIANATDAASDAGARLSVIASPRRVPVEHSCLLRAASAWPTKAAETYVRNLLGWLETRLAQNSLNYLNIS